MDKRLVQSDLGCHCEILEVSLPRHSNSTASIKTLINGKPTFAVLDTAAMVTLVRDDFLTSTNFPRTFGPDCVLTGIGKDLVQVRIIYNVPITAGAHNPGTGWH